MGEGSLTAFGSARCMADFGRWWFAKDEEFDETEYYEGD